MFSSTIRRTRIEDCHFGRFGSVTFAVEKVRPYQAIHDAADRMAPALRRAFLDALDRARGRISWREVAQALEHGDLAYFQRTGVWDDLAAELRPALRQAIEGAVVRAGQAAAQQFPQSISAQLSFDITNPWAVRAVDTEVAAIVQDLVNVNAQAVTGVIRDGFNQGIAPRDMARRIRDYIGLTPQYANAVERYRATLAEAGTTPGRIDELAGAYAQRLVRLRATAIARTETLRAANAGQQAAWQDAESQGLIDRMTARRVWIVTPDDRLCPLCEPVPDMNPDGVGLEEPFRTPLGAMDTPPLHPMCFPGDTLVASRDRVAAQSKRWYQGQLVIIRTAGGKELAATPNHPILTSRGWMAAGALDESDNLICDDFAQGMSATDDDNQLMPTRIKEVAHTLRQTRQMLSRKMPVTAEDFHGDGEGSQIAIIWADGLFWDHADAASLKPTLDGAFIAAPAWPPALTFEGAMAESFNGPMTAAGRPMRRTHLSFPLHRTHGGPLEALGLALAPQAYPSFGENAVNDVAADALRLRQAIGGDASQIVCDQLVGIERRDFAGHVYTLETDSGRYNANGIIVKNCRCAVGMEFPSE